MTFPTINGTLMNSDLSYLLVYANDVTNSWFGRGLILSFFLVVFIGGLMSQLSIQGRVRPDVMFLVSSFATLGLATILEMTSGILNFYYFILLLGLNVIGAIWVYLSPE